MKYDRVHRLVLDTPQCFSSVIICINYITRSCTLLTISCIGCMFSIRCLDLTHMFRAQLSLRTSLETTPRSDLQTSLESYLQILVIRLHAESSRGISRRWR